MERELGKVLAKLEGIEQDLQEAKDGRKIMYKNIEDTKLSVEKLNWRMDALEKTMNNQAPTIAEFLTYKEQVKGAGKLGKVLWFLAGISLSAAVTIVGWFQITK